MLVGEVRGVGRNHPGAVLILKLRVDDVARLEQVAARLVLEQRRPLLCDMNEERRPRDARDTLFTGAMPCGLGMEGAGSLSVRFPPIPVINSDRIFCPTACPI